MVITTVFPDFIDKTVYKASSIATATRMAATLSIALTASAYASAADASGALSWQRFSAQSYDAARASGAPFVVEFVADWCMPCKEMAQRTFTDPAVVAAAEGMTFLSVDMTTSDRHVELILRSFDVVGAPTTIFYGPNGKEWKRKIGFIGPADFADYLRQGWQKGGSGEDDAARGA